jgi:hypothetical protein
MKSLWMALGLAGVLASPNAFATLQVKLDYSTSHGIPIGGNSGGEFTATPTGWSALPGAYALGTTMWNDGSFQTFCVEEGETFNPGVSYIVKGLNTKALNGGVGPLGDTLSQGTSWLYRQFASGVFASYNYGAGRSASETALQVAIWALEDEGTWTQGDLANVFEQAVVTKFGSWANAKLDAVIGTSDYGVRVMNLVDAGGGLHQDNLVIVPEPTTMIAGALLLLPFGASTLRFFRKSRRA